MTLYCSAKKLLTPTTLPSDLAPTFSTPQTPIYIWGGHTKANSDNKITGAWFGVESVKVTTDAYGLISYNTVGASATDGLSYGATASFTDAGGSTASYSQVPLNGTAYGIRGGFSSTGPDSAVVTGGTVYPQAYYEVFALSGSDLKVAAGSGLDYITAAGSATKTVGFAPQVLFIQGRYNTDGTEATDAQYSGGFVTNKSGAISQRSITVYQERSGSLTTPMGMYSASHIGSSISTTGTNPWNVDITAMDATSFTYTASAGASAYNGQIYWTAFNFGSNNYDLFTIQSPATTGYATFDFGFKPTGLMMLGSNCATAGAIKTNDISLVHGVAAGVSTITQCGGGSAFNTNATQQNDVDWETSNFIDVRDKDGNQLCLGTILEFTSTGMTVAFTVVPATPITFFGVALQGSDVVAGTSSGSPTPPATATNRQRAWTYTLDGHRFYVLDLGQEGTFAYDLDTKMWHELQTDGYDGFDIVNGTMWGDRIVGGDVASNAVWEVDPSTLTDQDAALQIKHLVTGGLQTRNRVFHSVDAVRLACSVGTLGTGTTANISLRYSDDNGNTWSGYFSVALTEADYSTDVAFRSLGSFAAPGRVFEISDTGGPLRIDGCDADIDGFDDEQSR